MLERTLQLQLLKQLAERYPDSVHAADLGFDQSDRRLIVNASYLHQHGLIEAHFAHGMGVTHALAAAKATHRGMDFLADDGGLSAVLGVVTVRFEADTLRALIARHIDESDAEPGIKARLKSALQDLAADGLKDATKALLGLAWRRAPDAIQLLETLLRSQA